MWISNTATTAMMLPISQAVLEQLSATEADSDEKELREGQDNQAFELTEVNIKHNLDSVSGDKPNGMTLLNFILLSYNVNLYIILNISQGFETFTNVLCDFSK